MMMTKKMTIEEQIKKLDLEVANGTITPEEAEAEFGAIVDQEIASELRSAGIY